MISSKVFRLLAGVGLGLGMLTAPTHAGVFQASTTFDLTADGGMGTAFFSLPQYSGPGAILGVNLALSGSAIGDDEYAYLLTDGITVAPYSNTWTFAIVGEPPITVSGPLLETSVTAKYLGVSIAPCTDPLCDGAFKKVEVITNSTPFSGSANLSDLSDFKGSGSNAFDLDIRIPPIVALDESINVGSATVTETILTSVPEPSTWAMALIGFAMVGFAARSRRLVGRARRAV